MPSSGPLPVLNKNPWHIAILVLTFGIVMLLVAFREPVGHAVSLWISNSSYNHGFLIIPISLYIVWEKRHAVQGLVPEPNFWGVLGVTVFGFAWLIFAVSNVSEGEQFAVVIMIQFMILGVLGWQICRQLMLPILYLWLLVPSGAFMLPFLQEMATNQTELFLKLVNIPVYREGYYIDTPHGAYHIAPGCGGLNFILTSITLGPLFAYLVYTSFAKRVIACVSLIAVAIIANGVRIFGIIALAELTNRRIDIVDDHILYGWGFFALILVIFGFIGVRFADESQENRADDLVPSMSRIPAFPVITMTAVALSALIVAGSIAAYGASVRNISRAEGSLVLALPSDMSDWTQKAAPRNWAPHFPNADGQIHARFEGPRCCIDMAVAYYWRQSEDHELLAFGNSIADGENWRRLNQNHRTVIVNGQPLRLIAATLSSGPDRRIVWYWYWVDERMTDRGLVAKMRQAKATLFFGDQRAAMISISTEVTTKIEAAEDRLLDFLEKMPDMNALLASAQWRPVEP